MPVYEYECLECGARFGKLVRSISDASLPACSACGAWQTRKRVSTFAAHGLECQVDSYTGGDDGDLPSSRPRPLGRKEITEARRGG